MSNKITRAVKAAATAVFGDSSMSEYRDMLADLAEGREVDPEYQQSLLAVVARGRDHLAADVNRYKAAKAYHDAQQRVGEIDQALPAAKQRHQVAHLEALPALQAAEAEFRSRVAEIRKPVEEAAEEVKRLESDRAEAMRFPVAELHPCPALLRQASTLSESAKKLNVEAADNRAKIRKIAQYRTELQAFRGLRPGGGVPEWHHLHDRGIDDIRAAMGRGMTDQERLGALKMIGKAEAEAEKLQARNEAIPGEIAQLAARIQDLQRRAYDVSVFALAEPGDRDFPQSVPAVDDDVSLMEV